jgi:site-specific DNA-methyltransferase (adenine-specific)
MSKLLNRGLFSSVTDRWSTPQAVFDALDAEFHFTLDPCSTHENAKCAHHYTFEDFGDWQDWSGEVVFMNPPYGRELGRWVRKAYEESLSGATVVCLLPARTDNAWFHDYCLHGEIRFLRGRLRFGGTAWNAPFPSMVVVFRSNEDSDD